MVSSVGVYVKFIQKMRVGDNVDVGTVILGISLETQ